MINLYVSKNGNNVNDGLTPEKSVITIQEAVNKCPTEQKCIIHVSEGEYIENILRTYTGLNIDIIGEGDVLITGTFNVYGIKLLKDLKINVGAGKLTLNTNYTYGTTIEDKTIEFNGCTITGNSSNSPLELSSLNGGYKFINCIINTLGNISGSIIQQHSYIEFDNVTLNNVNSSTRLYWSRTNAKSLKISNMNVDSTLFYIENSPDNLRAEFNNCNVNYKFDSGSGKLYNTFKTFSFNNCQMNNLTFTMVDTSNKDLEIRQLFFNQEEFSNINEKFYSKYNLDCSMVKGQDKLDVILKDGLYFRNNPFLALRIYVPKIKETTITIPLNITRQNNPLSIGVFKPLDTFSTNNPISNISINELGEKEYELVFTPDKIGEYFIVLNYDGKVQYAIMNLKQISVS